MKKKPLFDTPLTFKKATAGTYVFAGEDAGISGLYIPKMYFSQAKVKPETVSLHLEVVILEPEGEA